jgi:hypothetical protein
VRLEIDQATRAGNRRMIRRRLGQHQAQKIPECEGIRRTPCDGALGVQAFEVADQQQSKVAARRLPTPTDLVGIESLTERLDVVVEPGLVQNLIQSRV